MFARRLRKGQFVVGWGVEDKRQKSLKVLHFDVTSHKELNEGVIFTKAFHEKISQCHLLPSLFARYLLCAHLLLTKGISKRSNTHVSFKYSNFAKYPRAKLDLLKGTIEFSHQEFVPFD